MIISMLYDTCLREFVDLLIVIELGNLLRVLREWTFFLDFQECLFFLNLLKVMSIVWSKKFYLASYDRKKFGKLNLKN